MAYNYLDLKDLFINQVSGSFLIFYAISLVAIGWICAKFRIPNMIILMLFILWSIMLSVVTQSTWLLIIAIVGSFALIGWNLYKLFSR
jgi:hypothetical protein